MVWVGCPREPQHECADTRHAETEYGPGYEESVALASIAQVDTEVGDGANQIDWEKDGAYGYVDMDARMATDDSNAVRDVWRLQTSQLVLVGKDLVIVVDIEVIYPITSTGFACLKHY